MLKKRIREIAAERYSILNRNLIVKNNEDELIELIKDIVRNIPTGLEKKKKDTKNKKKNIPEDESFFWNKKINYITHTKRIPTQKDKSYNDLIQYVKFRDITFDYDYYVRLEDSHLIEVNVVVMFSPYSYKSNFQDILKYNTKRELKAMMRDPKCVIEMSPNVEAILEYDGEPYIDPDNEEHSLSLLHELKLYIPINRNGAYIINGRRHYNGYFLLGSENIQISKKVVDEGGKQSKNDVIIRHRSSISFMNFDDIISHKVFGVPINPFLYEDVDRWSDVEDIFQEYDLTEEQWDQLKLTHDRYLAEKKEGILKVPMDKALAEIEVADIYMAIYMYYDSVNSPEKYDNRERKLHLSKYHGLRSSHTPNLEHPIRSCVPPFKNNEPMRARRKWNVHPRTLLTAIIQKKQFLSSDDVNPLDVFNMLYFVKTESTRIGDSARYLTRDQIFKTDLIYAPGEIGAAGNICPATSAEVKY